MNKSTSIIVIGILLVIVFILLVLWSIKISRENMNAKRQRKMAASRQKHKASMEQEVPDSKGYWYNKEDMADASDFMKVKYQHHFNTIDECVNGLIIEMYDCGLVKTEELYAIAYGRDSLTADSLVFKTYNTQKYDEYSEDDEEADEQLPPVSDEAQRIIYEKWCAYVDALLNTVEISASDNDKGLIIDELMTYGRKNLLTLMHAPD
jgi:FtsZ-interacting cell division protein ZipA